MEISLRHMLRTHLRASLIIALGAAILTFSGVMIWSVGHDQQLAHDRQVAEDMLNARQQALATRIGKVEQLSEADRQRLDALASSAGQGNGGAAVGTNAALQKAVGSIVELVCIDNANKDVYYTASGTVIDPKGLILTNRHALLSTDGTLIDFCGVGFTEALNASPKIVYIASAQAALADTDLALLKITERLDGKPLPDSFAALKLSDIAVSAKDLQLGDSVFIGGYPGIGADTFTFTQGVVSGLVGSNLVKTSALIDSGTSGGAAFDAQGRFIGVPTAAVKGEIGGSLGYLISSDAVDQFVKGYYAGQNLLRQAQ